MLDSFNRTITYLRISVTDRCNLRCVYCMPPEGISLMRHDDILRFDEILEVVQEGVALGISKIRITCGEPLVRKGVIDLIRGISAIPGIKDLSMTTNGQLLERYARELKEAGLHRVNISLDTMNADRYRIITRGGDLKCVLTGIEAAKSAGLNPLKLNCVIQNSIDEADALSVAAFAVQEGLDIRYIHQMDLNKGYFKPVIGGEGGHCASCNRLRLTSNGLIKPCLFSDLSFSVRELGAQTALQEAIKHKPRCGQHSSIHNFYNIGG